MAAKKGLIYLYLSLYQDFRNIPEIWIRQTARRGEDYLQDKLLVDVALGHGGLEVRTLQETQKELVHQLMEAQTARDKTSTIVCVCLLKE